MGLVRRPLAAVRPALQMGRGGRGKGQTPAQRRFVPYKLAGEFEVYPEDVPEYAPWTTELGMSRLPFTLDSLRQGELWLDAQRRLFASSVNEDQIARDQLLEDTRQQVRRLEEVVRHQNIAIADLGRQCAQLSNRQNGIEKTMRQEMNILQSEMVQLTSDVRALPAPGGTKSAAEFQDALCNELQRMSIVLRVGSGPQLPTTQSIEQRIQTAQEVARVPRSPGQSVMGSRPPSSRGASPAPRLCRS